MSVSSNIFVTRRLPDDAMARLAEIGEVHVHPDADRGPDRDQLIAGIREADAAVTLLTDRIDESVLAVGQRLKVVANYAVGFNNIDVPAATARGIHVTNTPGVLTESTADLTWALITATARHVVAGDRLMRRGDWTGWKPTELLGIDVSGATLGIIGLGRIGRAVARRAGGFGMKVLGWNRSPVAIEGIEMSDIDDVCRRSDFVTLHLAYTPETHHVIDGKRLALMKPTARLINTARGAHVDESALVDALRAGHLGGAGLDVFENEPDLHPGLAELDDVTLLPHLGSATAATRTAMADLVIENVREALAGRRPPNAVGG